MKNHLILILTSLLMFSCEQSPSNNPEETTKMGTKYEIESANWCTYSHPLLALLPSYIPYSTVLIDNLDVNKYTN